MNMTITSKYQLNLRVFDNLISIDNRAENQRIKNHYRVGTNSNLLESHKILEEQKHCHKPIEPQEEKTKAQRLESFINSNIGMEFL